MKRSLMVWIWLAVIMFAAAPRAGAADETSPTTVVGVVQDMKGQPLKGAEVSLLCMDYDTYQFETLKTLKTETDGKFKFQVEIPRSPRLSRKNHILMATKSGMAWQMAHVSRQPKTFMMKLGATKPVAGKVVNEKGEPVTGAIVYPSANRQNPSSGDGEYVYIGQGMESYAAKTDAQGNFRFTQLPDGCKVGFIVEKPEYARLGMNSYTSQYESGNENIKLELVPPASISGHLLDESGKPVAGIKIQAHSRGNSSNVRPVATDANGAYKIDRLTPGDYTVMGASSPRDTVDPKGLVMVRSGVRVDQGQNVESIEMKFVAGVVVTGRVFDSATSKPISKAYVYAYPGNRSGGRSAWNDGCNSDESGSFKLRVMPGPVSIQANAENYVRDPQSQTNIEVGQTAPKAITLYLKSNPPVNISGTVLGPDGKPAAGAVITPISDRQTAIATTDKDGRFKITVVRQDYNRGAEQVSLSASLEKQNLAGTVEVPQNAGADCNVTIKLAKAGSVTGTIVDEDGSPLKGASVQLQSRTNTGGGGFMIRSVGSPVKTNAEGKFRIGGMSDGELYGLLCTAEGRGSYHDYNLKGIGGETIAKGKIKLPKANCYVDLTVIDDNGKPVEGVRVYAYGEKQPEMRAMEPETDKNGKIKLGPYVAGELRLSGNKEGYTYLRGEMQLEAGKTLAYEAEIAREGGESQRLAAGTPAPKLEGVTWLSGNLDIAAAKGHPVALVFFAPGNRPSQAALGKLAALGKEFGDKLTVGAVCDASIPAEALKQMWSAKGYSLAVGQVPNDKKTGWASPAFRAYEVRAVPSVVLISAEGRIVQNEVPIGKIEQAVRDMMKK